MLLHCAHARYVWNLAVEQQAHWRPAQVRSWVCRAVPSAHRGPAGECLAAGRERGRAAAGAEGLRQGQERPVRFRVR
ncbi:hypothetical protein ACR6C2_21030 [Streptomyces sp. INA 01156]